VYYMVKILTPQNSVFGSLLLLNSRDKKRSNGCKRNNPISPNW
ncbi:hypothetical protein M153_11240002, partial [Pseudoloma neurophilia]